MGQDDFRKRTKTIGNGKVENSKCLKRGNEYKIEGNYKKIRKATEEEYRKLKKGIAHGIKQGLSDEIEKGRDLK